MTYNALSQAEQGEASSASDSDASDRSPALKSKPFEPLSIDFDNLGSSKFNSEARVSEGPPSSLASAIRSRGTSTTSYKVVENDDYEVVIPQTEGGDRREVPGQTDDVKSYDTLAYNAPKALPPEAPIQTPMRRRNSAPLRHPTPDLQSIQGAYVGNVERLEKTAESLSMSLENKGDLHEILPGGVGRSSSRPRGATVGSYSNISTGVPLTSRILPTANFTPPSRQYTSTNPTRLRSGSSASRLAHIIEPENENAHISQEQPINHPMSLIPATNTTGPGFPLQYQVTSNSTDPNPEMAPDRPNSAGSGDTYQQATNLFKNFDGVHFTPHRRESTKSRSVSLAKPPLAAEPEHYNEPNPGQNMVYYPAPVPKLLNLPQKLSQQKPIIDEHEKRRTQLISSLPAEGRKSAIWLPETERLEEADNAEHQNKRMTGAPAQLRASAFFEHPKERLDVSVQEHSAVATLEGILDAAAHAPVSAFTDHPIVGHMGAGVYGNARSRKKNKMDKHKRESTYPVGSEEMRPSLERGSDNMRTVPEESNNATSNETTPFHTAYGDQLVAHEDEFDGRSSRSGEARPHRTSGEIQSDEEDTSDEETDDEDDDDSDESEEQFIGAPTTLLAELEMRKQEQKLRTRTAANAFPNGMHSTLLELDSVAQRQREKRNKAHVTLAWEDPVAADHGEPDDEDVPLGVLFPEKQKQADENRPLGLMEKLHLEENEPLSRRRARIRGEPLEVPVARAPPRNPSPAKRDSTAYTLDIPGLKDDESEEEDEGETLAQRMKRLRNREGKGSKDFADELLSKFAGEPEPKNDPEPEDPEEETLAQRRKRLQAQAQKDAIPPHNTARHSMADILQAHPVARGPAQFDQNSRHPGMASRQSLLLPGNRSSTVAMQHPPPFMGNSRMPTQPYNTPYTSMPVYGNGLSPNYPLTNPLHNKMAQASQLPVPIDSNQRDMIDRWRLSVRQ